MFIEKALKRNAVKRNSVVIDTEGKLILNLLFYYY